MIFGGQMIKSFILLSLCFSFFCLAEQENNIVTFTPPKGWKSADLSKMSPVIKSMLVGTGKEHFPPTLTLAVEPFQGSLKDYLKIVKNINKSQKTEWKDLGEISTKAGEGSLSQFDEKSNWGDVRTMTAILVRDGNAYILSATALKEEFSSFYKDFFQAMRSLEITKSMTAQIDEKP